MRTWRDGAALRPPPLRNLTDLLAAHTEFIEGDAKDEEAKHHQNAVRTCVIATEIEGNVVPPPLHICRLGLANNLLDRIESYCKKFDEEVAAAGSAAPFVAALKATMAACRVQRVKRAGGKLTGDAALRFLNNGERFGRLLRARAVGLRLFVGDDNLAMRVTQLLLKLRNIDELCMRDTPLCVHEEKWVKLRVSSFACCWRAAFPFDKRVTPKMHMLAIDVPRFVDRHHTVRGACSFHSQHRIFLLLVSCCVIRLG